MEAIRKLLLENKAWSKSKVDVDPNYFKNMALDQQPEYLWIGCSDSRVPESEITNSNPGEIFVHRNIANLVVHTDINFLSILSYAVNVLKVRHVIVCGHYNCGGVRASMLNTNMGLLSHWTKAIRDSYSANRVELDQIKDEKERTNRLVEYNVKRQLENLSHTDIIQKAWHDRQGPHLHGWVYDLNTGTIKEIDYKGPETVVDPVYRFDFLD